MIVLALLPSIAAATVTVSVSQSGADSGSVIAGNTFTVSASGWSGDCSAANLDISSCPVCNLSESQSKSISGSTVSWTTLTASKASSQSVTVSISGACTPDSGDTSFDVKNPPSLSATVASVSVTQGSSASFSINIQNTGETTARFGSITSSGGSGLTLSDCSPSDIAGGQSLGLSCTLSASSSATTGAQTQTLSISPTNADALAKTLSVTVASSGSGGTTTTTSSSGGGGGGSGGTSSELSKEWASLKSGETATMAITSPSTDLRKVSFQAGELLSHVKLVVSKLNSRPPSVGSDPSGKVYQYESITAANVTSNQINSAIIEFRVDKAWMSANGFGNADIELNRYSDGKWSKLTTTPIPAPKTLDCLPSERTLKNVGTSLVEVCIGKPDYAYFSALTPGFSYFAITGEKKSAAKPKGSSTAPQEPSKSPSGNEEEITTQVTTNVADIVSNPKSSNVLLYILLAVFVLGVAYVIMKSRQSAF